MTKAEKIPEKVVRMTRFEAENTMRLKSFDVEFDAKQNVFVIAGDNAQGKSSAINAMAMTLGGARLDPPRVVREGEEEAKTRMTLDDGYVLQVTWHAGSARKLEVLSPDGVPQKSPQAWLSSKVGRYSFDPLAFLSLKPPEQQAEVQRALGLDFSALDAEHEKHFNERTLVKRERDRLEARLSALPKPPADEPAPPDMTALLAEQDKLLAVQRKNEALASAAREAQLALDAKVREFKSEEERIKKLEQELADAKLRLGALQEQGKKLKEANAAAKDAAANVEDVDLSLAEVRSKLEEAQSLGEAASKAKERETLTVELKQKEQDVHALTKRLDAIDADKVAQLSAAKFPVDGLAFSPAGLRLNGLDFSQASQAERIGVAVALGVISKPEIRLLFVREGSLLDDRSMALLGQVAAKFDAQVIVEAVGKNKPGAFIVIEDGRVLTP